MGEYSGQIFLINKEKIKKVIDALDLKFNDTVIEIGAGHGEITAEIVEKFKDFKIKKFRIIAIEKDKKIARALRFKIYDLGWGKNIKIVGGDALKILTSYISHPKSYKLVGNIPFYITGHLLRVISELKLKPELAVFIIQKEVAQRIISRPPEMNILAASVGFWAEPEIIDYISKKDFRPAPKVDSAVIKLTVKRLNNYKIAQSDAYYRLIKALFKQPRKTILNNLKPILGDTEKITEKLKLLSINPSWRPQNLTPEDIKKLSTVF